MKSANGRRCHRDVSSRYHVKRVFWINFVQCCRADSLSLDSSLCIIQVDQSKFDSHDWNGGCSAILTCYRKARSIDHLDQLRICLLLSASSPLLIGLIRHVHVHTSQDCTKRGRKRDHQKNCGAQSSAKPEPESSHKTTQQNLHPLHTPLHTLSNYGEHQSPEPGTLHRRAGQAKSSLQSSGRSFHF